MAQKSFTFTANAETQSFNCRNLDVYFGDSNKNTFGGGTVALQTRCNPNHGWTVDSTYTAQGVVKSTSTMAFEGRFVLTGATSPDLIIHIITDE